MTNNLKPKEPFTPSPRKKRLAVRNEPFDQRGVSLRRITVGLYVRPHAPI
jgi:hypothetical protein